MSSFPGCVRGARALGRLFVAVAFLAPARSLVAVPRVGDAGRVPSFRSFEVEDAAEALASPGEAPAPPAPLPWDIERRVNEAKAKVDDDRSRARVELIRRRRERKKELLRSLQLAKLRQRLTAFGFSEVDAELSRVQEARKRQDSFEDVDLGEKASWLGPLVPACRGVSGAHPLRGLGLSELNELRRALEAGSASGRPGRGAEKRNAGLLRPGAARRTARPPPAPQPGAGGRSYTAPGF